MTRKKGIVTFSVDHPRVVAGLMVALAVLMLVAAGVPSLRRIDGLPDWLHGASRAVDFLPEIKVDTDPENMLSADEPVRVFHDRMKERMDLNDIVVVGVVNDEHPEGVFNPASLRRIHALTEFAKTLQFDDRGDRIPPATTEPSSAAPADEPTGIPGLDAPVEEPVVPGLDGAGEGKEPVVPGLDGVTEQSRPSRPEVSTEHAGEDSSLRGVIPPDIIAPSTVDSIEPKSGALVFSTLMRTPPTSQVEAEAIRRKAMRIPFLKGTLVSDDGKMIAIYLPITSKNLSYQTYRALREKIASFDGPEQWHITGLPVAEDTFGVEMFVQMAISAPAAMLVIFVLMYVFFRKLIVIVSPMIVAMVCVIFTMGGLILAGFPIHIMSSMIPIFIMPIAVLDSIHIISEFFEKYQQTRDNRATILEVMEDLFAPMLYTSLTSAAGFASLALTPIPPVQVFGVFVALGILLAWLLTITFIPAFVMFIPARMLESFGSTHHAEDGQAEQHTMLGRLLYRLGGGTVRHAKPILVVAGLVLVVAFYGISRININDNPVKWFDEGHPIRQADNALNAHFGGTYMAYLAMEYQPEFAEGLDADAPVFKRPDVLRWMVDLQEAMARTDVVGKSNSLADIVRTVHRDLLADSTEDPRIEDYYRIPDTQGAVAQTIFQFESSNRPQDLWHFVTPDYRTGNLWVQLTSGDNQDMERVVRHVEQYVAEHPPPVPLQTRWFGLTYINVIWQDKMVVGMRNSFLGSFLVVFLLMTLLFRSVWWGLLSMIPLTVTIAAIYGAIGLVGKDYDMPVAVLSSLTLGLAVDFAIHFLARARALHAEHGSWTATAPHVFGEPARAITRNIIVIAAGFTPLLLAPLVPYQTVGILLAAILLTSGVATLLLLPAIIRLLEGRLFRRTAEKTPRLGCNCGLCLAVSILLGATLAINFYSLFGVSWRGWGTLTWLALAVIPLFAIGCNLLSRRRTCNLEHPKEQSNGPDSSKS